MINIKNSSKHFWFVLSYLLFFVSLVNAEHIKIDSTFINKSNTKTLLGKYKGSCPASLQNKNIDLKLSFNDAIKSPTSVDISDTRSLELDEIEYDGDFKEDISENIKKILNNVCNTTFEQKQPTNELSISLDKFESTKIIKDRIEAYAILFVGKQRANYFIEHKYAIQAILNGDIFKQTYSFNNFYGASKSHDITINGTSGISDIVINEDIKYIDTNITFFGLQTKIHKSLYTKGIRGDLFVNYKLSDSKQNKIAEYSSASDCSIKLFSVQLKSIADYKLLRMMTGETSSLISFEFDDKHATGDENDEAEDEDDDDNIDGIFSFMVYDLVKSIIENAN